ncbi:MAG: L-lactate dehydrogenase [Nitrospirae bacterium]|nr:L-lactate dehydrogenase [Nitrospirota bacterium]
MKSLSPKVAVIGAGNVGSTFAFSLMISGLAREIVLIDRNKNRAEGECMDLSHGLNFAHPTRIYSSGFDKCKDADVVVITAGINQKPGHTRIDLVEANAELFKEIIPKITKYAPDSILLVVSNPVDILTYVTLKVSGFPPSKVIGSGTVLDSSRFRYLLSEHCGVDPRNVHAYIVGEHGDTELPLWSSANIGGMTLDKYCLRCKKCNQCNREEELSNIFEEVKKAAYKIIEAKGSTYYAVSLALVKIVGTILRDENSILPVSTLINDYDGINDICLSIPSVVNKSGVDRFLRLKMSTQEQEQFKNSANTLKEIIRKLKL